MSQRSDRIVAMVLEYGRCFSEALMHEAASKADLSESEAHKWLRKLRSEIDALDAEAESVGSRPVTKINMSVDSGLLQRAMKAETESGMLQALVDELEQENARLKLVRDVSDFVKRDALRFRKLLMQDKHWLGVFACDPDGTPCDSLSNDELKQRLDAINV